jgi:hypothetical protein
LLPSYEVSGTDIAHLAATKVYQMLIVAIAFTTPAQLILTTMRVLWDQEVPVFLEILKLALDVQLMPHNVVKANVAIFSLLSFELDLNWLQGDMLNRKILTSLEMDISSMLLHCKLIWMALL